MGRVGSQVPTHFDNSKMGLKHGPLLTTSTRLYMMFMLNLIIIYMENPTKLHLMPTKQVLRYLNGTNEFGILYKKGRNNELIAYTDSDYADNLDDRKSTSCYVFLLCSVVVSWSSKKPPIMSLSTIEAEFICASSCACQAIKFARVLEKLYGMQRQAAIVIHCDSSSGIKLSKKSNNAWAL